MNKQQREIYVRKTMLKILDECGGLLLPEPAFFAHTSLAIEPSILLQEFNDNLKKLEAKLWIAGIRDEFGVTRWKITNEGSLAI